MEGLEEDITPEVLSGSRAMATPEDWLRLHALEFAPHRLNSLLEAFDGRSGSSVCRIPL